MNNEIYIKYKAGWSPLAPTQLRMLVTSCYPETLIQI